MSISTSNSATGERTIYSVSQLNDTVKGLLENSFPPLWVEAELSNLSRPASGHWYFTLKDDRAQLRCAMWRSSASRARFVPNVGDQVLVRGSLSLYSARGEYQLSVDRMEPAGLGALQAAFEQLKQRLQQEGLFDAARKQPLPRLPRRIGIITSPTGAAVRDILSTLQRRYPLGEALLFPVPVQGTEAAPAIVAALQTAARRADCDVLIVARGGGSMEDLWAFNEEAVARAIAACPIPVISGVGHETDTTIADFVADLRATTPTGAAEHASPDAAEWVTLLQRQAQRLQRALTASAEQRQQQLQMLTSRLQVQHPQHRLMQLAQRLDDLEAHASHALRLRLGRAQQQLDRYSLRLNRRSPAQQLAMLGERLQQLRRRLPNAAQQQLSQADHRLRLLARGLNTLSPLHTLERGYAIALHQGKALTQTDKLRSGDSLTLRLHRGQLECSVTNISDTP